MTAFVPRNILLQIYAEDPSTSLLEFTKGLAKTHGSSVTLVDVIPDSSWPARLISSGIERAVENVTHAKSNKLEEAASSFRDAGVETTCKVLNAPSSVAIVKQVVDHSHDLVIRETKSAKSRRGGFFGTTATRLLRRCPCPVLLTKPGQQWPVSRVAAAVDVSSDDAVHAALNSRIIEHAQAFCESSGRVDILTAWRAYGEGALKGHMDEGEFEAIMREAEEECHNRLNGLLEKWDLDTSNENVHFIHGEAASSIPEYVQSNNVDLLVMGTVARAGLLGFFIGNTAEQILSQMDRSVLAIKPADFSDQLS